MRKTSISFASISGLAAGLLGGLSVIPEARTRPVTRSRSSAVYRRGTRIQRYPEQSTRQALRGQRRAQGGPGIELNPRTFAYEARA